MKTKGRAKNDAQADAWLNGEGLRWKEKFQDWHKDQEGNRLATIKNARSVLTRRINKVQKDGTYNGGHWDPSDDDESDGEMETVDTYTRLD